MMQLQPFGRFGSRSAVAARCERSPGRKPRSIARRGCRPSVAARVGRGLERARGKPGESRVHARLRVALVERVPRRGRGRALAGSRVRVRRADRRSSTGLRLDFVDPPADGAGCALRRALELSVADRGLRVQGSDSSALGLSLQHAYSENPLIHGLSSWSLGFTTRPVNSSAWRSSRTTSTRPRTTFGRRPRALVRHRLAIRPFGTRVVELGSREVRRRGRAVLGAARHARHRHSAARPAARRRSGQRRRRRERARLARLGADGLLLQQAARLDRARRRKHVRRRARRPTRRLGRHEHRHRRRVPRLRASRSLGSDRLRAAHPHREHAGHARARGAAAQALDDRRRRAEHRAVVFELRTTPAESLARVPELRDAIALLCASTARRCSATSKTPTASSLYLCSAANRILINPAGGIRFAGLRTRYFYFKGLLDKLGIRADFVRIGAHKSAPEMFTATARPRSRAPTRSTSCSSTSAIRADGVAAGRRVAPEVAAASASPGGRSSRPRRKPRVWSTATRSTTARRQKPASSLG